MTKLDVRWTVVVTAAGLMACTVDADSGNTFGTPTTAPSSVGSSVGNNDTSSSGGTGDSGSSSETTDALTSGATTTTASTTGPADSSSTTMGVSTSGGSTTGMGGGGGQPPSGQYSHCLAGNDCTGGGVTLCFQALDAMMTPIDGFCTTDGCANPAVDCDPSPGGTATPICYPIDVGGTPEQVCALDCSANKTCPTGMECLNFTSGSVCA